MDDIASVGNTKLTVPGATPNYAGLAKTPLALREAISALNT
jgi:hypothetical protein